MSEVSVGRPKGSPKTGGRQKGTPNKFKIDLSVKQLEVSRRMNKIEEHMLAVRLKLEALVPLGLSLQQIAERMGLKSPSYITRLLARFEIERAPIEAPVGSVQPRFWQEHRADLQQAIAEGGSAKEIATRLSFKFKRDVTRNTVIGAARRAGLSLNNPAPANIVRSGNYVSTKRKVTPYRLPVGRKGGIDHNTPALPQLAPAIDDLPALPLRGKAFKKAAPETSEPSERQKRRQRPAGASVRGKLKPHKSHIEISALKRHEAKPPKREAPKEIVRPGCLWPLWGFDDSPTHKYCGVSRIPGKPYCEDHHKKAHTNAGKHLTCLERAAKTSEAA